MSQPTPTDLRQRLSRLLAERQSCIDSQRNASRRQTAIDKEVAEVNLLLSTTDSAAPTITDHALIRYIERRYSLDLSAIKSEILPADPNLLRAIHTLGDGRYPVGNSHKLVVKGNTITTVLPIEE